jgi:hypothetical protein
MVAALALAGGACGGDDDEATDDAVVTTDGSDGDADSGDENDDSGGNSGGDDWCDQLEDTEFDTPQFDNLDINDPDSVENAFQEVRDLMEEAADSAPDEIEDDVRILVDQAKEFFEALEDADFNFGELDDSALETPEADAAAERIDEFCGFDDDTGDTVDLGDIDDTLDTLDLGDLGDIEDLGDIDEGNVRDQMVQTFKLFGMTDEQATCVVDNIDLADFENGENVDPSLYFDLFDDCGFDLTNPGG